MERGRWWRRRDHGGELISRPSESHVSFFREFFRCELGQDNVVDVCVLIGWR